MGVNVDSHYIGGNEGMLLKHTASGRWDDEPLMRVQSADQHQRWHHGPQAAQDGSRRCELLKLELIETTAPERQQQHCKGSRGAADGAN